MFPPIILPFINSSDINLSALHILKTPAVSQELSPIKVSREYIGIEAKKRMFRWYQVVNSQGYKWRTKPGEINIIFIRGCDFDFNINPKKYDRFSDLMVVAGKKLDGSHFVKELRCTTQPGWKKTLSPLVIKNNINSFKKHPELKLSLARKGLGRVIPGQYFYNGKPQNHCGNWGALRLAQWQKVYGVRDINGDGVWSPQECKHKSLMEYINIHWINSESNRENVEGWSEGCFVVPLTHSEFKLHLTKLFQINTVENIPVSLIDARRIQKRLLVLSNEIKQGSSIPIHEEFVVRENKDSRGWFIATHTIRRRY